MASIYFHYNELLRLSAEQAVMTEDQQQDEKKPEMRVRAKENQDEDGALKTDIEATLAALQPRMNRLAESSWAQAVTPRDIDVHVRSQ
ncbi:hypothetical protein F442_01708 [Phytophthora nicotianae P10297]|uniref:Uncharacterized protein n=2 Tax=Phytophthora nicotianae TaxID=4792 RepID=W2QTP0_PHYN3|nr:hypothetical protein PPTG_06875 [Phytophthora nicotianae INRA-310]ETN15645.1 hypothetical protein PPTG_06875 [Phytophthora nicotianae INRA-310]ETP53380.1 hypothetical protein F442_01708 [Phytophthora nicotianae P10297]